MQILKYLIFVAALLELSCKKNPTENSSLPASITVVNAIAATGNNSLLVNSTGHPIFYAQVEPHSYYANDGRENFNGAISYGLPDDKNVNIQVVKFADTTHLIYDTVLPVQSQELYTLFLAGDDHSTDAVLIKENFPKHADSTTGVRFVSLCPNAPALAINLVGSPSGSAVSSLAYKQITEFKNYDATSASDFYDFEIRDAGTDEVLTRLNYHPLQRLGNVTFIIRGLVNGSTPFEVVRLTNY